MCRGGWDGGGDKKNHFHSNRNAQFKEHRVLLKSIYKECVGNTIKETADEIPRLWLSCPFPMI